MFEPEEITTTETLPEVLTAAQITTAELARLEKYRGEVLPDVTDRKAALALDEKRKEVKRIRLVAEKICDGEREEAMRTNQKWLGIKGDVCGRLKSVEKHLDDEFARHEEWKRAEAKRIEDEKRASREKRLQQAREADCAASIGDIETMDEAQWSAMIESAKTVQATKRRAVKSQSTDTAAQEKRILEALRAGPKTTDNLRATGFFGDAHMTGIDTFGGKLVDQLAAKTIVADAADQRHLRTEALRGDRLVGALAAGKGRKTLAEQRFSRRGEVASLDDQIHVDAANHENLVHTPALSIICCAVTKS